MKRTVIKINEELCNGCGICVEGCHEGALQLIDGKARMVSDLYCDGLGACIGDCPVGAIDFEEREAEPYNEIAVMDRLVPKGEKTIRAHLLHLKAHNETELLAQGLRYLEEHNIEIDMDIENNNPKGHCGHPFAACPGSREMSFAPESRNMSREMSFAPESRNMSFVSGNKEASLTPESRNISFAPLNPTAPTGHVLSQLRQWPVQLHLLNPQAGYFRGADVVLAADCTAYAYGGFHDRFLQNRTLAIACPKLDSNKEMYVSKIVDMIDGAQINTLTVVMMEVPCCGGLLQLVKTALEQATNKVPVKRVVIGIAAATASTRIHDCRL